MSSLFGLLRTAAAVAALPALLAVATGCNSTPTVPVPPPEFCEITPPVAGLSTVSCDRGQTARNIALVYDEDWGQGVMQETNDDGSFSVELETTVGDTIIVQIKYDDRLSAEVYLTVPAV